MLTSNFEILTFKNEVWNEVLSVMLLISKLRNFEVEKIQTSNHEFLENTILFLKPTKFLNAWNYLNSFNKRVGEFFKVCNSLRISKLD